jgi:hypothetical protein
MGSRVKITQQNWVLGKVKTAVAMFAAPFLV